MLLAIYHFGLFVWLGYPAHQNREIFMARTQDAEIDGQSFELVIRNCNICTASDVYAADIGIAAGKIICIGTGLPAGDIDIDAEGRIVTPGGVDAHCHLDQPVEPPAKMADDFPSGKRSAAYGGATTIIPFAAQMKGGSLLDAVDDYHRRADKDAYIDYAFHLN